MSNVELTADEIQTLREVLSSHLADLKTEIADTDAHDFRDALKRREAEIARLLARLASA